MTENLIALDGAILLVMLLGVQLLQPAVAVVAVASDAVFMCMVLNQPNYGVIFR